MQEWNRLYQGLNRQTRAVQTGFGRTLTLGGERVVGDRLIMEVDAGTGRYWRAVAFDRFTGRQWINTAEGENHITARNQFDPGTDAVVRPRSGHTDHHHSYANREYPTRHAGCRAGQHPTGRA